MWKFWAILSLAILAAGGYALVSSRSEKREAVRAREVIPPVARVDPAPAPKPVAPKPAPETTKLADPPAPVPPAPPPTAPETAETFDAAAPKTTGTPSPADEPYSELITDENDLHKAPPPPTPAPEGDLGVPLQKFGDFEVLPAKVEQQADGSLLLDGKFPLKGEGTAEKPYIVSWDLLVSAEEAFDPQNGRKRLPQRVTMLDGKHIRLSGFVAFPMTSKEPRELLAMLNQWDGCCIGVPPTPYDAVEVALRDSIVGDDRFATTGRVAGVFHVKPFLQGDWLIGLYVMEDATLTPREFGGAGAN
jgi:hypothetical protein